LNWGFKACVSLKKYAGRYGSKRIEEACRQILTFSGTPSIKGISILLKKPINDTHPSSKSSAVRRSRGITRGASQFKGGDDK